MIILSEFHILFHNNAQNMQTTLHLYSIVFIET